MSKHLGHLRVQKWVWCRHLLQYRSIHPALRLIFHSHYIDHSQLITEYSCFRFQPHYLSVFMHASFTSLHLCVSLPFVALIISNIFCLAYNDFLSLGCFGQSMYIYTDLWKSKPAVQHHRKWYVMMGKSFCRKQYWLFSNTLRMIEFTPIPMVIFIFLISCSIVFSLKKKNPVHIPGKKFSIINMATHCSLMRKRMKIILLKKIKDSLFLILQTLHYLSLMSRLW